jgi:hypothetical protein
MIFNGVRLSYSRQVAHVIQLFDSKKSGNETEEENGGQQCGQISLRANSTVKIP